MDHKNNELLIGLLTIAFTVLNLTGVIDWSWWWVLSPIWIVIVLALLGLGIYYMFWLKPSKGVPKHPNPPRPPEQKSRFQIKMDMMMKEAQKNKE